ncbi:hypothetical protein, partial [Klebsiella pneumoniae]|uniref:hypothetical protein n=1 Tax=Klebsiella pneumoniae TaxID=573 RepID=UPI0032DB1B74
SSKELTAAVTQSASEIQESKATLRAGSDAIVKAQRGLLEIGPFAENQITSSMNLVVTTIAPQVSNMFKALIDSTDLKAFPALMNQAELLLEETEQNIASIRTIGEQVVASNNHSAASNRDLLNQLLAVQDVAGSLESRLGGGDLLEVSGKIEQLSKGFTRNLEAYKGSVENVFANLTNVLVNRLGGELEAFIAQSRISEHELRKMGDIVGELVRNELMTALFEDARKDV